MLRDGLSERAGRESPRPGSPFDLEGPEFFQDFGNAPLVGVLGRYPRVTGPRDGVALVGMIKIIARPRDEFVQRIKRRNFAADYEIPLQLGRNLRQQKTPCSRHLEASRLDLTLVASACAAWILTRA